jgi:protein-tyrosine kinase
MEMIEKALAKARAGAAQQTAENHPAVATSQTAPRKEATRTFPYGELGDFSYSRTQVNQVSTAAWINNRLVAHLNDRNADLFRLLRTKVLQIMREHGWRTLAVVGATAGVGKSTLVANLALSIALDSNQTVLVVDADLRKPRVGQYFGLVPKLGLGDYLSGDVPIEELLINPGVERLVVMPSCRSYANSSELLASRKMSELVTELRSRYESRLVIFDLPPLLATGDALGFLPQFDCALLVVENGGNTAGELTETRRLLQKTHLIGWVLNKADAVGGYYYQQYYGDQP